MDGNAKVQPLIKGCLKNKKEHQKKLYLAFYGFAHSIALRYARRREDASLIVNKGCLYAFTRLREYKKTTGFNEWLRDLVVQAIIDHYHDIAPYSAALSEPAIDEDLYTESRNLERTLSYDNYIQMLYQLPDACRIAFNLFAIDGYGHERIANLLNISVHTSEALLASARRDLRRLMNAE